MPLLNPTSKQTGKREGNAFKAIRTNCLKDKVSARPPSIPLPHWKHGTINQFQWISTEPGCQGGTGEDEEEAHKEEM